MNWHLSQQGGTQLTIEWLEAGGPAVEAPTHQGFGTTLIRSVVEHQLQGKLSMTWVSTGLQCSISLPLQSLAPH